MSSGIFDQNQLVLWAVLVLGCLVVLLIVATLAIWTLGNARLRWRGQLIAEWESTLLGYLCSEDEEERQRLHLSLSRGLKPWQRQMFGEFVLDYLVDLRGEDADRLRALLQVLSFDVRAAKDLGSASPWRRAQAARLLGEMRAGGAEQALIERLDDSSPLVSFAAAAALIKIGSERAFSIVAEAIAEHAEWNAGQINELSGEGGNRLAEFLHDILSRRELHPERAKIIVDFLGALRYLPSCETLLGLLKSSPPLELRIALLRSLGRLELDKAFPEAIEALDDPNWVVRSQAALALGRIGNREAVLHLARTFEDHDYWVRHNAAVALKQLGAPGVAVLEQWERVRAHRPRSRARF